MIHETPCFSMEFSGQFSRLFAVGPMVHITSCFVGESPDHCLFKTIVSWIDSQPLQTELMPSDIPKILIVDDEAANIDILARILESDYELYAAKSGEEALVRLDRGLLPDLMLLDVRMPGMNGYALCNHLNNHHRAKDVPVIFVTAVEDSENETLGLEMGAVDYIKRPFNPDIVRARVKTHLELGRERRESENRYRTIFENMADGIVIYDLENRFIAANKSFYRNTGYSPEDLREMTPADIHSESDIRLHAERFSEARRHGSGRFETRHVRKDGSVFPVEVNTRIIEFEGRRAALDICRDITVRKQAEAALARDRETLEELVRRRTAELREKERRLAQMEKVLTQRRRFHRIVGKSEAMQSLYDQLEELVDVGSTVIITGESGTGKELVAEALHHGGLRRNRPFSKIVFSDISDHLIESELFGHIRGSYTGAISDRRGRLEKAGDGTLFLDEIGDIPPHFQKRLLRVIEDRRFERVGASSPITMNARIVAATNLDLRRQVQEGRFREDLYFRLKVVELKIPPLRERREDISLLASHFLAIFSKELQKEVAGIDAETLALFMGHFWPGNVRELKHVLEYACLTCKSSTIGANDLPSGIAQKRKNRRGRDVSEEAQAIQDALRRTQWNKTQAAELMGISRRTFYRRLARHLPDAISIKNKT